MNGDFKVDLGVIEEISGVKEESKGSKQRKLEEGIHENIRIAQEMTKEYFEEIEEFTLFFDNIHKTVNCKSDYGLKGEVKNIGNQVKTIIKNIEKHKGSGKELLKILDLVIKDKQVTKKIKPKVDLTDAKKYCFLYTTCKSKISGYSRVISLCVVDKTVEEVCIGDRFPNNSLSCRINDNLIFLYIGQYGVKNLLINLDESILEPQLRKESVVRSIFNHYQSAFVLFDGDKIGFFGAEGNKNEFFDIRSKNWYSLPDIPIQLTQPTACAFETKIYIVDQVHTSLIILSVKSLKYKIFNPNLLQPNTQKLIFSLQGQIFLLQGLNLLTFSYSTKEFIILKEFTYIRNYRKIISLPLLYESNAYFLTNYRKVLSLSLSS